MTTMNDAYVKALLLEKYKLDAKLWANESLGQIKKWIKWFKGVQE